MSTTLLILLALTSMSTIGLAIKDIINVNEVRRLRAQVWRDSLRRHPAYQHLNLKESAHDDL